MNSTEQIIKTVTMLPFGERRKILDALERNLREEQTALKQADYYRLQQSLYEQGLISEIKPPRDAARYDEFAPLETTGKPASESIIEERR